MLIHATCVAVDGHAALICGPSAGGKSDLALRLIDGGARLVADDQVALTVEDGRLIARPPPALAGRMEVRGIGIVPMDHLSAAAVALAVDLVAPASVPRLPERASRRYLGVAVPLIVLAPFEASAAAKLRLALDRAGK
jgi:serine kinase of HPr protein (carbohydrate metabolism regulator)